MQNPPARFLMLLGLCAAWCTIAIAGAPGSASKPALSESKGTEPVAQLRMATQPAALAEPRPTKQAPAQEDLAADPERGGSPPANNSCAAAEPIAGTGLFPFNCENATQDGQAHFFCNFFGQSQIDHDVWFKWTASATANFVVDTCQGTTIDTKIAVYNNAPCPLTDASLVSCNDESCSLQSRVSFGAIAGQMYIIRVGTYPGAAGGPGTLRIQFQSGQNLCNQLAANCQTRDNANGFDASGRQMRDDFRVSADVSITKLCFWGGYFSTSGGCSSIPADHFTITYYDDVGGSPGFPMAIFTQGIDFTLGGPVPTGSTIAGVAAEYAYTVTHPAVELFADNCYWVEITNDIQGGSCAWYWEKGTGGNNASLQDFDVVGADLAFCLDTPLAQATLCQAPGPPTNDSCAGAKSLFNGESTIAQTLFATTAANDPAFSCRAGGSAQGVGTLWYKFVAAASTVKISTCDTPSGDSLLALYSGSCGNLTEIACNDDSCGLRSQLCSAGLTVGQTYYIQVAAWEESRRGPYNLSIVMPCPLPPSNDACAGAITINYSGGFGSFAGTTALATIDAAPACAFSPITAPGVWHKLVGNGQTLTASLCSSGFDTKINVYCGSCTGLTCVAQNDDGCAEQSLVSWCSEPGRTYYLLIFGFNGAIGEYTLFLTSDGEPCGPYPSCTSCSLSCPPGAIAETEACGADTNGGCNSPTTSVQVIQCGQTVCGTASTSGIVRDTDWYQFTIDTASIVTWSVQAELPVEILILDDQCEPEPGILAHTLIPQCGSGVATATLEPGTYRAFVANNADAFPCGTSNDYVASLACTPIGACCTASDCVRTTQTTCASLSGTYAGDGTSCATTYALSTCGSAFEDISASGTLLTMANDNDTEPASIGFVFRFYGVNATALTVSADGYLTFTPAPESQPVNSAMPNASAPNAVIAPLWDDFAPTVAGTIHVQTVGTAPNRRFIAQWKNVPQFIVADSNTFQAVLFEGTNCIEFRYGQISPQGQPGDYTIGVENFFGTAATSANAGTISQGTCLRLCPSVPSGSCLPAGCAGDANGDGSTNFADVTSVLANFGGSGPLGDANHDGTVSFADITSVLANFGCAPQDCPGDANQDGAVSFADITSVLTNFGSAGPLGDANHDGVVSFADITSVLTNFNSLCLP